MKYLLKLANGDGKGWFEKVNKHTFDNYQYALADDGVSPRYEMNQWIMVNDDGTVSMQLTNAPQQDIAVLVRGLSIPPFTQGIPGGTIREPTHIKFVKGRTASMLEVKTGVVYSVTAKKPSVAA